MTRLDVADLILRFVDGNSEAHEWDDFVSIRQSDHEIESLRSVCANIPIEFPPNDSLSYCSDAGIRRLRDLAQRISELRPSA